MDSPSLEAILRTAEIVLSSTRSRLAGGTLQRTPEIGCAMEALERALAAARSEPVVSRRRVLIAVTAALELNRLVRRTDH